MFFRSAAGVLILVCTIYILGLFVCSITKNCKRKFPQKYTRNKTIVILRHAFQFSYSNDIFPVKKKVICSIFMSNYLKINVHTMYHGYYGFENLIVPKISLHLDSVPPTCRETSKFNIAFILWILQPPTCLP